MRRQMRKVIAFIMILVMLVLLCPNINANAKNMKKVALPALKENSITLFIKGKYETGHKIQINNLHKGAVVRFESANKKIARVSEKGIVVPVKKGETTITAQVVQNGETYTLSMKCLVRKASLKFGTGLSKKMDDNAVVTTEVGKTLKTGLKLNKEPVNVYSADNTAGNVKAVIFNAKNGKRLTTAKHAADNKYISVSGNGALTGKKPGKYYIEFTSVPKGMSLRLYVTVTKASKKVVTPTVTPTATPTVTPTATPTVTPTATPTVTPTPTPAEIPAETTVSEEIFVKFDYVNGCELSGSVLPTNQGFKKGTAVGELPCPEMTKGLFLGWFYDEEGKLPADATDMPDADITLYAEILATEEQKLVEKPVFVSVNVEADRVDNFSFEIENYNPGCIDSFVNAANETDIKYTVDKGLVMPVLEKGETYTLTLKEGTGACIVVNGEIQPESVVTLNIITGKEEVMNLSLNKAMKYLAASKLSGIDGELFDGLYTAAVNEETDVSQNESRGSFYYNGKDTEINVGDIVAVYQGQRPDERSLESIGSEADGAVAYVQITEIKGNKYDFVSADAENVLEYSEVLPVNSDADKDGDSTNNSIRVSKDIFDYSGQFYRELGLDSDSTADEGDYIIFYKGSLGNGSVESYARITSVRSDGDDLIVGYEEVTEGEVITSMDIYTKRNGEIDLTEEEKKEIENEIEKQAEESGFLAEAGDYLVALAIETNGFKELSDDLDMDLESYNIHLAEAETDENGDRMLLMGENTKVNIKKMSVTATVLSDKKQMVHFNKNGLRVELGFNLILEFINEEKIKNLKSDDATGGHMELTLDAKFIEELYFDTDISGKAVWKKKWIFPYISDYKVTTSLECGTFTEIAITSTVKTMANNRPIDPINNQKNQDSKMSKFFDSAKEKLNTTSGKFIVYSIGDEIKELMKQKGFAFGGEDGDISTDAGVLGKKYSDFIKQSGNSWIQVVKKRILKIEGSFDPLHIFAYGLYGDFVINVNLFVTLGFTLSTGQAKKYIFEFKMKGNTATTTVKDIMNSPLEYEFYVFGTAGIKAGIEFEISVGIGKLSWDSVGIVAGCGAYAQLWGFFYAHYCKSKQGEEARYEEENYSRGALLVEIGIYLEVKFRAQLLSKKSLTVLKSIYEKQWPLYTMGERDNIIGFSSDEDTSDGSDKSEDAFIELVGDKETVISSSCFDMECLDLKSGKLTTKNFDDYSESSYIIKLSNSKFGYDPESNRLIVNVDGDSSDREECEMKIIWAENNNLSFSGEPISKNVKIVWTDPDNARYISYESNGGSFVKASVGASGSKIEIPENPVKTGYVFDGWYSDTHFNNRFTFPETMPNYESRGITVYAKWIPAKDTEYTVEYYVENLNGRYDLVESQIRTGETGTEPAADEYEKSIEGARLAASVTEAVRPDGQTVIKLYYKLNECTVTFTYGEFSDGTGENNDLQYTVKYGTACCPPAMRLTGYNFDGYEGLVTDEAGYFTVKESTEYAAKWTPSENTAYFAEHYLKNPENDAYELIKTESFEGVTGTCIDIETIKTDNRDYVFEKMSVENDGREQPVISAKGDTVIRLYYDRSNYSLSFVNAGTVMGESSSVKWGRKVTKPIDPVRSGYVFTGWYTDSSFEEASRFNFEEDVMPAFDFTLYAGYVPAVDTRYTVNYYVQNADDDGYTLLESDDGFFGTTDTTVSGIYRDIEHFVPNESAEGTVSTASVKADGSTVLKLYYDRKTVTFGFDANGGVIGSDGAEKKFRYGEEFAVEAPHRDDYAFVGWFTADGSKYEKEIVDETESIMLIAGWDADLVNYKIEHYVMNTDGQYVKTGADDIGSGAVDSAVEPVSLKKSIYEVPGGIFFAGAATDDDKFETKIIIRKGMTVKLFYERKKYDVGWKLGEFTPENEYTCGQAYYDSVIVKPVISEVVGYRNVFLPEIDEKVQAHDAEYSFMRCPITYKVRFVSNASDAEGMMQEQIISYGESRELFENRYTRKGYIFDGWSLSANAAEALYKDRAQVHNLSQTQDDIISLYTVWKNDSYSVELVNSVVFEDVSSDNKVTVTCNYMSPEEKLTEYTYGKTVQLPIPFCEGFDFEGWYDNDEYEGERITEIGCTDIGNKKFYPKWRLHQYFTYWDANGGYFIEKDGTKHTEYAIPWTIFDSNVELPEAEPSMDFDERYMYVFSGWYTEKNGGTKIQDLSEYKTEANQRFYAKYARWIKEYTVNWVFRDLADTDHWPTPAELAADDDSFTGRNGMLAEYGTVIDPPEYISSYESENEKLIFNWYNIEDCELIEREGLRAVEDGQNIRVEKVTYKDYVLKNPSEARPLLPGDTVTGGVTFVGIIEEYSIKDGSVTYDACVDNADDVTFSKEKNHYGSFYDRYSLYYESDYVVEYVVEDGCAKVTDSRIHTYCPPDVTRKPSIDREYIFEGWYTGENGIGKKLQEDESIENGITFYAKWKEVPRKYRIIFDSLSGSRYEITCEYGTKLSDIPYMDEFEGYVMFNTIDSVPVYDSDGSYRTYNKTDLMNDDSIITSDIRFEECEFPELIQFQMNCAAS